MAGLGSRVWAVLLIVVGVLAVGGVTYAMVAFQVDSVKPQAGGWVNRRDVPVEIAYTGRPGLVSITVDGKPLQVSDDGHVLKATARGLSEGRHAFELVVGRRLGLSEVRKTWEVSVDTKVPAVKITSPTALQVVSKSPFQARGRTEPNARLTVTVHPAAKDFQPLKFPADAKGEWSVYLPLAEARNTIRVDAVDAAGNRSMAKTELICDRTPPVIAEATPKAQGTTLKEIPDVTVRARINETGSGVKRASIILDEGKPVPVAVMGGAVEWTGTELAEGERRIALEVEDNAGQVGRHEWTVLVDTTETFGRRQMTRGAKGKDVARMQKRLVRWGLLLPDEVTSIYDERTEGAVREFQMRNKIDADGMCGFKTIGALSPRILVNLSRFSLLLIDGGKKVRSYSIAHGTAAYPTPPGDFRVVFLERDPTWIPPKDSLWAREAKVTPPGPGNPLGTRWIGLDSGAVGIHGTPADYSIGSRASHGCIRMHIPDVEDLFERVNEGTEVIIFWEEDRQALTRKWWGKG